jgi:serine protease Do
MRRWFKQLVGTLGVGVAFLGSSASAQNLSPELYEAIIKASVQFVCFDQSGKGLWQGSGSFIGREGIILTNNHVVANEQNNQVCPILRISMMKNEDQPPEPRYIGRVVTRLPNVDLALVQVATDLRGNPVPAGTRFPAVPLGDSNGVRVGDRIFNFGFPDINGTSETITVSSGSVNGFLENRTLMKHDALSGPGGSGGGLYNLRGEMVAVHSAGVSGNNNTRQPLGRPLVLGLPMIQQNVRGFGEPWTTQLSGGGTQPTQPTQPQTLPTQPNQPPILPTQPNQPPSLPTNNSNLIPAFPPKVGETWTVTLQGLAPRW